MQPRNSSTISRRRESQGPVVSRWSEQTVNPFDHGLRIIEEAALEDGPGANVSSQLKVEPGLRCPQSKLATQSPTFFFSLLCTWPFC